MNKFKLFKKSKIHNIFNILIPKLNIIKKNKKDFIEIDLNINNNNKYKIKIVLNSDIISKKNDK